MVNKSLRNTFLATVLGGVVLTAGCSPIVDQHGYLPITSEVNAIQVGNDSKESVLARFGEPTSYGLEGDNAWYYISYSVRTFAFLAPKVTDREILAVTFAGNGKVASINTYGLEQGRVVNLESRETVTGGRSLSVLQQMLGNIGNFSAESFI